MDPQVFFLDMLLRTVASTGLQAVIAGGVFFVYAGLLIYLAKR